MDIQIYEMIPDESLGYDYEIVDQDTGENIALINDFNLAEKIKDILLKGV